jgi:hypothetical protein
MRLYMRNMRNFKFTGLTTLSVRTSHQWFNPLSTVGALFSMMRTFNFRYCLREHGLAILLLVAFPLGAQTLNVDMVVPMNTSTPGTAFTTAIGNAGTVCSSGTTCSWSSVVSGGSYSPTFLVGANQGAFTNIGPVQVNGTGGALYSTGSLNYNNIGHQDGDPGAGSNAQMNFSGTATSITTVSALVPITLTMPGNGSETNANDMDMFIMWQATGVYDVIQFNAQAAGTACDGLPTGQIGVRLEGDPTIHTPCIFLPTPASYYISVYWDLATGFTQMRVYTAQGTLVPCTPGEGGGQGTCNSDGSTSMTMGDTGEGLAFITIGNNEVGSNNGTISYFQNIMMNWTTAPNPFFWTGAGTGTVAPVISSATTDSGTVGTAISYQITATNTPTSFSATGLPGGLSVNTSTGLISGTPSAAGTSTVTLSATNSGGTGTATLTLTISSAGPVITSGGTANGTVGTAFSYQITATNTPTSFSATGLPGGLSVNTSTGLISGTPSAAGNSTVTLSAANSAGTGTATLTLSVASGSTGGSALWTGVLSSSRAINWSGAGVVGGIPNRTKICTTLTSTATTAQINAAIASCSSAGGGVVLLSAGTYSSATGTICFNGASDVTLRGAGANQTFLAPTQATSCNGFEGGEFGIGMVSGDGNSNSSIANGPVSWSAGYAQGTNVITLASVPNLKVGNLVILDQLDTVADNGGILVTQADTAQSGAISPGSNGPYTTQGEGDSHAMRCASASSPANCYSQQQIVTVTSCNGTTTLGAACSGTNVAVGISPPLYMPNWASANSSSAWWSSSPALNDGVEDLSLNATNDSGAVGIELFNCGGCWVKGNAILTTSQSHVQLLYAANASVVNNYLFLTQNAAPASYGLECDGGTAALVENNIMHAVTTPLITNGTCVGSVWGYNYTANEYFTASAGYSIPAVGAHGSGDSFTLAEGNITNGHTSDVIHGTANLNTDFRNFFQGIQPECYASGSSYSASTYESCNNNVEPELVFAFHRFYNIIGNILGTTGTNTTYETSTIINGVPTAVLGVGYGNVNVPSDPNVSSTLMLWGNADSATGFGSPRFNCSEVPTSLAGVQAPFSNPCPSSNALPPSFYSSAAPSWWPSGKPWPLIGPDVTSGNLLTCTSGTYNNSLMTNSSQCSGGTSAAVANGYVNSNPAMDCYLSLGGLPNGTGPVLSNFSESSCYGSSSGVLPPTALSVLIQ